MLHEHDLITLEIRNYEKVSHCTQCVTCEASYCLLCGKMSNTEKSVPVMKLIRQNDLIKVNEPLLERLD